MMGNREDFEKWARDQGISLLPAPFQIGTFSNQVTEMAFRAWQARQPEIDAKSKVIDDLALQKWILKDKIGRLESENGALKAEVERLRVDAESASMFLCAMASSMSVSPTFQKIAMRHHESLEAAIDAATK